MNWIFETYSNVYNTAMMHDVKVPMHVVAARKAEKAKGLVSRLLAKA